MAIEKTVETRLPIAYKYWHPAAQDAFLERVAIMREANNIPDGVETPAGIIEIATRQAATENAVAKK